MKKINITTALLVVYLLVMAVIFWPGGNPPDGYGKYIGVLGGTLLIIILLRFIQIKRMKLRDKWKDENKDKQPKP